MKKNNIIQLVMAIAIAVLFIMQYEEGPSAKADDAAPSSEDSTAAKLDSVETAIVPADSIEGISLANTTKLAYFNLTELQNKSSYLKRKLDNLKSEETRFLNLQQSKARELQQLEQAKMQELEEYKRKKMLVQSHYENAQREMLVKQQEAQKLLAAEEERLFKAKSAVVVEMNNIVKDAVDELNKVAGWDYVLVDNDEIKVVIPLNDKFDITDQLATLINKKHK